MTAQSLTLSPFDEVILNVIAQVTNPKTGAFRKVYPYHVARYIPVDRSIRSLRRDLVRLANAGFLHRLGPRKGYCLPPDPLSVTGRPTLLN